MTLTFKASVKLLENLRNYELKKSLYRRCTGNSEITSKKRVEQVYNSIEPFAIWILSKLRFDRGISIHSDHLNLLMPNKYRPLFETLMEFDLMSVESGIRLVHPTLVKEELGLDKIQDYHKKQKLVHEFLDSMNPVDRVDYIVDYSITTEAYKPNVSDGNGRTKSYLLGSKGYFLKIFSAKIDYTLTDEQVKRITKAFESNKDYDPTIDKLRSSIKKVICTATEDDIEDYISDKITDSGGNEIRYASQKKLMQKIIKGERKVWQKGDYNKRVMNTLLFASSEFRSEFFRSDTGEKMIGSDISSAVPFFLIDKFMKDKTQFNDDIRYIILHDRISNGMFYHDIAHKFEVFKHVIKKPMLKVFNRRRNYELDRKKEKWAYKIEKHLKEMYPEFFQFICDLNTERALKEHFGHAIGSKLAYVRKKGKNGKWITDDHGNYVTVYKPNRAMSLIYAEWETEYILECVRRIHDQIGDIAMFTTYDAIYVGESHQPQVQQIMEQVAKEKFNKPLTIKREN